MTSGGPVLFRELATVVALLAEETGLRSYQLPYPAAAQRMLDRMVLHCAGLGVAPPMSLPELLEWCRSVSAGDRLFNVPPASVLPESTLVHPVGLMPTRTCLELSSAGAEEAAGTLLAELADRCGPSERFQRCRQFLALNPVVHQHDRHKGGWSREVWSQVSHLYQPPPDSLIVGGTLLRCGTCGLPALLSDRRTPDSLSAVSGPATWCEGETCPDGVSMELVRNTAGVLLLRKPLRVFLALPFRLEQKVLAALDGAAIGHQALPGALGGYRLRGDGLPVRRLHVQVRVQPALLAERFWSVTEPVVVAVPEEFAGSAGYQAAFARALSGGERVVLTGPSGLIHRIRDGRVLNETRTMGGRGAHSDTGSA
ncbi:hypothetical protein ACFRAR_22250 [Kitasatospora sp. NPDC056651]|uniref:pPIWI_RE_Y domain-containing protein n=1 Tax=Kitasatospora sp. NPDC056651 TaxID=3345892 RepID=UPI003681A634